MEYYIMDHHDFGYTHPSFTHDLLSCISAHDNAGVRAFLKSNKDLLDSLYLSTYATPPAVSLSSRVNNLQAMCLLLEAGWVDSVNTSLRDSVEEGDFSKARLLVSFGLGASCDDCYECGLPNTCAMAGAMSSYDARSPSSRDALAFWCRSHDRVDVYRAFHRFVVGGHFTRERAEEVLRVVDDSGNGTEPMVFPPTASNMGFLSRLCERGRVDLDGQAHYVIGEMMTQMYSFVSSPGPTLTHLLEAFKMAVDRGASVDTKFRVEGASNLDYGHAFSVREIASGFTVAHCDVKRVKRLGGLDRHDNVRMVQEHMQMAAKYIRSKSRERFIVKRLRGFGRVSDSSSDSRPGYLERRLVDMPTEVFVKILGYVY
jgi:hypothetical protein